MLVESAMAVASSWLRKGLPGDTEQPTDQEDHFRSSLLNSFVHAEVASIRRSTWLLGAPFGHTPSGGCSNQPWQRLHRSLGEEKGCPEMRHNQPIKSAAEAVNS
jgi:hypothetical protein